MEAAIRALLLADPAVNAACAGRVVVGLAESFALPRLMVVRVATTPSHTQDGPSGPVAARFVVAAFAATALAAIALAAECRRVLDGYRGAAAGGTLCGVFWRGEGGRNEEPRPGEPTSVFRETMQFDVVYDKA